MKKIASNTQGPFYRYIQSNLPKYGVKSKLKGTVICYSLLACKVEIQKPSRLIMV